MREVFSRHFCKAFSVRILCEYFHLRAVLFSTVQGAKMTENARGNEEENAQKGEKIMRRREKNEEKRNFFQVKRNENEKKVEQ